jgi:AcrR family transcriptional regulator
MPRVSVTATIGDNRYIESMTIASTSTLRERTRRAVQKEIADAALRLFVAQGYAATTIDDIAVEVGMSPRSVFRYFATKEEIVVGKFDLGGQVMLDELRARPAEEPPWQSLRRVFDIVDEPDNESTKSVQRVIFETPALFAVYLQKLQTIQDAVSTELIKRLRSGGVSSPSTELSQRAMTAAAFGCLITAQHAWMAASADEPLSAWIDRAMLSLEQAF